jgi:uncharacterized protein (TIGR03084 family)
VEGALMAVDLQALATDTRAETTDLVAMVRAAGASALDAPTPADGWTVRDQLAHLAFYDGVAVIALTDPQAFAAIRAAAMPDLQAYIDAALEHGHGRDLDDMLGWVVTERSRFADALAATDPGARVPWFGPDMTPASKGTARLMESWAHGQDVADALGVVREPSARLRHVAHIGVRALPNSFRTRGIEPPDTPVHVALTAPDESLWTWGDAQAVDRVTGPALDFCLVVTQRRHLDDTALAVTGPVARQWMSIAQAYAGPAGPGRTPSDPLQPRSAHASRPNGA